MELVVCLARGRYGGWLCCNFIAGRVVQIPQQLIGMKRESASTLDPLAGALLGLSGRPSAASTAVSVARLPAGAKTIGNYLLGKNIGQGSFGKVHLALHLPTSEKVAIKIIDKARMRPQDKQRVLTEIEVLGAARHRHVLSLYEIIETEKSLLLVTEFLPNGQLFRHIIKEKKIAEDEACTYFQQLIEAVDYLHRNKIAHRDLKPENVLLDHDRQLKVIDFGLSELYRTNPRLATFCGSPCYAAPEVLQARQPFLPLPADLWSCGVVLYAMLCGHLPFCDADPHALFRKIQSCAFKLPSHLSPDAQDLLSRLLVAAPQQRMSVEEIREHRWFNRVAAAPAYGLDFGEHLPADAGVLERLRAMGVDEQKVREDLLANKKTRETASYLILMKKLVKSGQLVPSYLGDDNFNPKLIMREDKMDEPDTESYNGPDSDQITTMAPEAPELPAEGFMGPLAGSNDFFSAEEPVEIDEKELMLLASGILDLFLPKPASKPAPSQISEVFAQTETINPVRKLALEKRESEFYAHNRLTAKKQLSFAAQWLPKQEKPFDSSTVAAIYRSQMRSALRGAHPEMNKSISKRERTAPSRPENNSSLEQLVLSRFPLPLKRDAQLPSKLQKKDVLLPSLPQRVELLKAEARGSFFGKRYKAYKNNLH